jgi:virulence factor Mce-like protein
VSATESSRIEDGDRRASEGDFKGAERAYREADESGDAAAAGKLGLLLERRGKIKEARAAYERADERGDGFGAFRLGLLLSTAGDWEAAEAAWKRADERGHEAPGLDLETALRRQADGGDDPGAQASPRSAFASPVLIGAVTVLVILVAVFLAYNANNGLPFVPTRELKVDLASGAQITPGNDVREGGFRVGEVTEEKPVMLSGGRVGAQLTLQLDQKQGNVPVDSTASIRPVSALGTKYVDLHTGRSRQLIQDGGTLAVSHTSVPVQFDDVLKTFDARTRGNIQGNLSGYGGVLAARGGDLNDTISALPSLFGHLRSVAGYLSQPSTGLVRFIDNLNSFMAAVAPVAHTNVLFFRDMGTTFAALSRHPVDLEQTIAKSPGTEAVGTDALRAQQPFLVDLTSLGRALGPATADLHRSLPVLNPAIEQGARVLGRTPPLDQRLQNTMVALRGLATAPGTNLALHGLAATVNTLNPMVRYLGPFQTVCDYWNYWWTYLSEHLSAVTSYGFAQRVLLNLGAPSGNGVGQQGATAPANGTNGGGIFGGTEFLHAQPYGAAIDGSGNADCETGQRGYPLKLNSFDPQGRNLATDVHTPGAQGATFKGRARVPKGETYTREPQTGPQLTPTPGNP